ncbi:ABC transporter permease [Caldibacillus lycopersici]|uniref:ABC transporter permease n=1 Tax=Perspicuibacillus lycopersici TaxID=1325689 RepID=A0AAE3ITV4_9BACI|nr:ABC transporter permease [Perspicuibacillus lycopersici]MCU9614528.1 ABC transporter permease [Perspicuibacillus lycopersici]
MIGKLIGIELMKIKRKGIWFLTVLGPIGVVALQIVNYSVRKDYLLQQSEDDWLFYLLNTSSITPFAIILGIVILTSFMASIENETNAWKQLVAMPVSKYSIYLSKYTVLLFLLLLSASLLTVFTFIYGLFLDLGEVVPYRELFMYSFYPLFAAFPVLGLQLWVSFVSTNQGIPVSIGVIGVILSYSAYVIPDWLIWKWPSLMNQWDEPLINVWLGLAVGFILYFIGMLDFHRRDVK